MINQEDLSNGENKETHKVEREILRRFLNSSGVLRFPFYKLKFVAVCLSEIKGTDEMRKKRKL